MSQIFILPRLPSAKAESPRDEPFEFVVKSEDVAYTTEHLGGRFSLADVLNDQAIQSHKLASQPSCIRPLSLPI